VAAFAFRHSTIVLNKQYPVTENHRFDEVVSGIYIIQNVETDRCYIGASRNVGARWASHRGEIMYYRSPEMKQDYKNNPNAFVFVLIERCTFDELADREVFWVDAHQSLDPEWGYNVKKPLYRPKRSDYTRIHTPAA